MYSVEKFHYYLSYGNPDYFFFALPVSDFELSREERHHDEQREGHHEGDYGHVDAYLGHLQLELLPKVQKKRSEPLSIPTYLTSRIRICL